MEANNLLCPTCNGCPVCGHSDSCRISWLRFSKSPYPITCEVKKARILKRYRKAKKREKSNV